MSSVPPAAWPIAPPTSGPPASQYPPSSTEGTERDFGDPARVEAKTASNLLVAGSMLHLIAIPVGLLIFKALIENVVHRSVSWGEIFDGLVPGYKSVIVGGIIAQVIFASIAGIGAFLLRAGRRWVAIPMVVIGAIAVATSFVVFGGIVGALGGLLTIAGGSKGRPKPLPPWPPVPPPYAGPPPYRPRG